MIKEITLPFISELRQAVIEDKIVRLCIKKEIEEGRYIADYEYSKDCNGTDRVTASKIANELERFQLALLTDKVVKFELYYIPETGVDIVNSAYKLSNEENYMDKLRVLIDSLDKVLFLSKDLDIASIKVENLFEKVENKTNKKTRYAQLNFEKTIKKLVNILN